VTAPSNSATTWNFITGEYPPEHGGVADYTQQLAARLCEEGCNVHVWCRGNETSADQARAGLTIHRTAGTFGLAGLRRVAKGLEALGGRRILLVQYVPHGFGCRGMNVLFCLWLLVRRMRADEVRVMFHEIAFPFVRRPLRWNLLAIVQRAMAMIALAASTKVYTSAEAWNHTLRRLSLGRRRAEVLPVPSNLPAVAPEEQIARARRRLGPEGAIVVGHFGTYAPSTIAFLTPILDRVLSETPLLHIALLGRGSAEYRRGFLNTRPQFATRVTAFDDLAPEAAAASIQACDIMLQPFHDGASTRRTSLMACLATGTPTITTFGANSEPVWQAQKVCAAVRVGDVDVFAEIVRSWLADPSLREESAERGRRFYFEHFSLDRTIDTILARPVAATPTLEADVAVND